MWKLYSCAVHISKDILYKAELSSIVCSEPKCPYVSYVICMFSPCSSKVIIPFRSCHFLADVCAGRALIALLSSNKSAALNLFTITLLITDWTHTWLAFINVKLIINKAISKPFSYC